MAVDSSRERQPISRRNLLKAGLGGAGLAGAAAIGLAGDPSPRANTHPSHSTDHAPHLMPTVVGEVDHVRNRLNPTDILTDFDVGKVSTLPSGQPLREYTIAAENKVIEIVPGMQYAAWTYNGRIPGPTIRVQQGDRVR